jgi:hypothetical protein
MANTATAPVMQPSGAAFGPAGQLVWGPGDAQEPAFVGTVNITGDGSSTGNVSVNWIDGTQTLPFLPRCVLAFVCQNGGTTATAGALAAEGALGAASRVNTVTTTSFNLDVSVAITNAAIMQVLIVAYK